MPEEVANCPLCGKEPMIYPYTYIPFAYECCGVQCYSIEKWNRYAAAMELAKAEVKLERTTENTSAHDAALVDIFDTTRRVLEVFK